jgi:aspartate aminotransferase
VIAYSYGKVLLAPGQRLGYLALSPLMPGREQTGSSEQPVRRQMALGWCFPNAVMQYALPDLEGLSIDMDTLSRKRARMTATLERAGYHVLRPEGTFYLFCKYPGGDGQQVGTPWPITMCSYCRAVSWTYQTFSHFSHGI